MAVKQQIKDYLATTFLLMRLIKRHALLIGFKMSADFSDLKFDDTKSDLYYRYVARTDKKRSYQYMITQEETRFNFHRHVSRLIKDGSDSSGHTGEPHSCMSNWHWNLSCNAARRLKKWTKLNEESCGS